MRFKKKVEGKTRIKSRFLFFPKEIRGDMRWLEYASWEDELHVIQTYSYWWPVRWIDKEKINEPS